SGLSFIASIRSHREETRGNWAMHSRLVGPSANPRVSLKPGAEQSRYLALLARSKRPTPPLVPVVFRPRHSAGKPVPPNRRSHAPAPPRRLRGESASHCRPNRGKQSETRVPSLFVSPCGRALLPLRRVTAAGQRVGQEKQIRQFSSERVFREFRRRDYSAGFGAHGRLSSAQSEASTPSH